MGGGSSAPAKIGGISGQGGGRILPGSPGRVGEVFTNASRATSAASPDYPDRRPNAPVGSSFDTGFTAPGGGPGQPGRGYLYEIFHVPNADTGGTVAVSARAGGGGGWGAAGGVGELIGTGGGSAPGNPGAAGGKAIDTNGHAVTWLAGSDQAYGAVG